MNRTRSIVTLLLSVLVCLSVGGSASLMTSTSVRSWYPLIQKPSWTPPDALFGPVWTLLYVLMGVSLWLVWRESASGPRRTAIILFAIQLLLNALWSFLFFGLQSPGLALVEIVMLWASILATTLAFARVRRVAAGLLVPYLAWVSFAVALNASIWSLNR